MLFYYLLTLFYFNGNVMDVEHVKLFKFANDSIHKQIDIVKHVYTLQTRPYILWSTDVQWNPKKFVTVDKYRVSVTDAGLYGILNEGAQKNFNSSDYLRFVKPYGLKLDVTKTRITLLSLS